VIEGVIGMDNRLNELQAKAQAALIEFINNDLDLAFTMIETARIEAEFDPQEVAAVLEHIRQAWMTIRHFTSRVQDQSARAQINFRTDQLEAAVAEFGRPVESN
jgi:hypothetical protein